MKHAKLTREVGNWVSGEQFWDREVEVESFIEQLDEGAHLHLVAPRRTGKTSLLREVARRLNECGDDYALYVDLERAHSAADAVAEISLATREHTSLWDRTREVFANTLGKVETLRLDDISIKLRDGLSGDWRGKGDRLLESLSRLDRPVALFLDEFPILVNRLLKDADQSITSAGRQEADAFLSWIRAASLQYVKRIRLVLSGSIGLGPILRQAGLSATINSFRTFELEPWRPDVAQECLQALARQYDLTFGPGAAERVIELLGVCIPHHVQMFFSHLYEDGRRRWATQSSARNQLSLADVDRVYRERMLSARGHAELSHFEERLRSVLGPRLLPLVIDLLNEATHDRLLAEAAALHVEEHLTDTNRHQAVLREVLDILEHDGYLVRDGEAFVFGSRLLRDWWRARFGYGFVPIRTRRPLP